MEITVKRHPVVDYMLIMLGTTILAIAINMFFDPMEMVIGGVTGLAIVIKDATKDVVEGGIPIYITNLVINIPLFVIGILTHGKNFGARSFFATVYLSFALVYTKGASELMLTEDILLGSIYGGVIAGVGLGLVFSAFSTTGGTDLAASIIQRFAKHFSVAQIMLFLDSIIIAVGFFTFGPEKTMYAILSVFISVKVIDGILEGLHFAKAVFIISSHNDRIAQGIFKELERGVTGLEGRGKYTNVEKEVLLCVVSKRQIAKLKEIVRDIDHSAFMIVADVREVVGEGFIEVGATKKKEQN